MSDNRYFGKSREHNPSEGYGNRKRQYTSNQSGGNRYLNSRGGFNKGFGDRQNDFQSRGGFQDDTDFNLSQINWDSLNLAPIEKNFYREDPDLADLQTIDVFNYRRDHEITIKGHNAPRPVRTFEEAGFPAATVKVLYDAGFTQPTPIQAQCWPAILMGKDLIGIAETGSGKTLGFMLPAFTHSAAQLAPRRGEGPIILALAPTRELACQIKSEAQKFAPRGNRVAAVYGGASKYDQKRELYQAPSCIVATPGRLLDFLSQRVTNLQRTTFVVLDEADRMLDMGFEPQIRQILNQVRPDCQILMFSATWPKDVQNLAQSFIRSKDVVHINVGSFNTAANSRIEQRFILTDSYEKPNKIMSLMDSLGKGHKVLIFTATKRGTDQLTYHLVRQGIPCIGLHGDKTQAVRDRSLAEFKRGHKNVLVATDVCARGLDVKDIATVINYDMAGTIENYAHRIGRTARAGNKGISVTFLTSEDYKLIPDLIRLLRDSKQPVPPELDSIGSRVDVRRGRGRGRGRGGGRYGGQQRRRFY